MWQVLTDKLPQLETAVRTLLAESPGRSRVHRYADNSRGDRELSRESERLLELAKDRHAALAVRAVSDQIKVQDVSLNMVLHNEIEFEMEFAEHLAGHGWLYSPNDTGYDRKRALFPNDVFSWLTDTQPEQLEKVVKPGSGDIAKQQAQLLDRIVKVLDTPLDNGGGTLNLLRKGFSHLAAKFQMCFFKPELTLNEKRKADYAAVRVRVMRQVHFSAADQRSVDLVFFVNGLPVATAELKTDFTPDLPRCDHSVEDFPAAQGYQNGGAPAAARLPARAHWCTSRCPTTRSG